MAEYTALTPDGKFLLHYGVKGMKWGKHNSRLTREQLEQETGKGIRKTTSPKIGYTPRIKNDGDKESKDSKVEKVGRPRGVNYTQQSLQSAYTDQLRRSYTKQEDPKGNKKKGTKKVKSGSSAKNSGGSKRTSTKSSTTSKKR